jgi:peptidoglycan/xylan/chitin deacetylase (PgdA/CDA1 family)
MTTLQVQGLHDMGNELAAHGVSHADMTAVNDSQIIFQLQGSQRYIKQKLHAGAVDYASPYGKSDAEVQFYARQYFRSVRGTDTGLNTRQNIDLYNLRVLYVGSKTTSDEIHKAIEDAAANNGWLVLTYHRIENPTAETRESNVVVSPLIFRQHMNLLRQSGIAVKTVQQALDEVSPQ